ncbi:hypothetical protein [Mycobacteroides abscessus]|uniref:hypothetical protein n=1 Tax=Mycobacteroides abscessus TaxID=36809 RepID=UPI002107E84D|nr:hypothetical protein [Mycobacteroides abscessus]
MTDENEVAIHDRQGFADALTAIDEVRFAPLADALTDIPGATDGSDSAAMVSAILADAQEQLAASDAAVTAAVTTLRGFYTEVTGVDATGETRVLEA